ncbi:MAG: ABC transporter ATP-binding protein [Bacteroidia bacterium]|nr:ABC transporter ATP-binding protein [Bacteroidia bacterium]
MVLKIDKINVYIGVSLILREVSIEVNEGEIVCLVGRNGAGKSTTLRSVMGFLPVSSGKIELFGQDLTHIPTYKIARMGLGYSPEDTGVFADLSIHENIEVGAWMRESSRTYTEKIELAYQVFPKLKQYMSRRGDQISGGERKMLSIARALASDPIMLMLDEPYEGLSPTVIPYISERIKEINNTGLSMLIAESELHHVPEFVNRLYVIERGQIIFSGRLDEVQKDENIMRVIAAG